MNNNKTNNINLKLIMKHPIISLKRKLHPILLSQMPGRIDFEIKYLNEKPEVEGPVLYLINHSNVYDAPVACVSIENHFYIVRAKQPLALLDLLFFKLNGDVKIDRDSKKSCRKSVEKMSKLINSGSDVLICPEATWCKEPSTPINHFHWGWVEVAQNTGATVVPLVIEYYEQTDNCCYVKFGDPIKVSKTDDKLEKNNEIEDCFATIKYEMWNKFPMQKRNEVDINLWDKIMKERYSYCPKVDPKSEEKYIIGSENDPDNVLIGKKSR